MPVPGAAAHPANWREGRDGLPPRAVVVHTTDGSFEGTLAWFASAASGVSAHHVVDLDGTVVHPVDEADTAFHAGVEPHPELDALGDDPPNAVTIGIEMVDDDRPFDVTRPPAQYRAAAELLAGAHVRWGIPLDRDHVLPHNLINRAKTCPGNVDLERLIGLARRIVDGSDRGEAERSNVVVLLPARNAAHDLPGWFASVERFADAVVALDDGSTDTTAQLLEAHPLVRVLLRNPRRDTYEGWDDSANRNRLLAAAEDLHPRWILSLDADERIPADDAAALRHFLTTDALPGLAYGMQCFRMWGDECEPAPVWVYRLFGAEPGQRFPTDRLHFDPVPTSIGRRRHVRTSLRVQHVGSADEARRAARVAKYAEADPAGAFPTGHGGLDDVPTELVPWLEHRDPDQPMILGGRPLAEEVVAPELVVLLPARNAAHDLPGWFASVERFADAVVALDDGSTDTTAQLLEAHPLVRVLLRNPRRDTYEGWDDSANRNRLLAAAEDLHPRWILSLDADERIPADDAAALRHFLTTDALPGLAYGMQCFRMIDDEEHYDRNALTVYRLFAAEPGQRFPTDRLHFVPVPTSIPRSFRVGTTIRIQHLASLTADRRRARFDKYVEADPHLDHQGTYDHLLDDPDGPTPFPPRPVGLPVLVGDDGHAGSSGADDADDAPVLSAIVISRDDEDRIERAVRSVVEQDCPEPFEVIVVTSGTDATASMVRRCFPDVRVVELDHPALPGEARNAGLRFARGELVSFPGSHVELLPGSLAARVRAHDEGWTMVTGTTHNGTLTATGWAAYFLDNSSVLPGRPSEPLSSPPAHCSYETEPLLEAGGFPDDVRAGEDTQVNNALFRSGHSAYRATDLPLVHHNRSRGPAHLVRHHVTRGRAQVQFLRAHEPDADAEARVARFLSGYPARRMARIDANVDAWGAAVANRYRIVRPLVRLGVLAAWLGAHLERHRPSRSAPGGPGTTAEATTSTADPGTQTRTPGRSTPLTRPLRLVRPEPARLAGSRTVFLHLPKTAGSTLLRILEREHEGHPTFRVYGSTTEAVTALETMPEAERAGLRLVAGHMAVGIDRFLPGPSAYVTMLRDPVDRIVSHYHYVLAHPQGTGNARAIEGIDSLDDYVRSSVFARIVNNGQARLLGSDVLEEARPADGETLARAMAFLDRPDVVVGVQDRFDESVLAMVEALGWGLPAYRRENVTRSRPGVDDLRPATVELIRERNALDLALYEHARRHLEQALDAIPDRERRLDDLRLAGRWLDPTS